MSLQDDNNKLVSVGNYILTGKTMGKGNFARVEEAYHAILDVKTAIKIMDVSQIKEDYVIRNLYREARILSQLHHPCITALYQTMQNENVYYIVSELAGGGDLCSYIKTQKDGKLEEKRAKVFARQLVSAIAYMHNLGIVHRDLKMENVMLNSSQTEVKIVDFGLSNVFNSNSLLRTHCGSPEYAAPELFVAGKAYGPEVDLWSLGVILYGMVVGKLPFVCNREELYSTQDRRTILMEQIKRGICSIQKRALLSYTSEFKAMIYKLLIPEEHKRLKVRELIVHPWLTDKGSKMIKPKFENKIDEKLEDRIINRICSILKTKTVMVRYSLATEPLGDIAGMYNILLTKYKHQHAYGDSIIQTASHNVACFVPSPRHAAGDATKTSNKNSNYSNLLMKRKELVHSAHFPKNTAAKISATNIKRPSSTNSPKKEAPTSAKPMVIKKSLISESFPRKSGPSSAIVSKTITGTPKTSLPRSAQHLTSTTKGKVKYTWNVNNQWPTAKTSSSTSSTGQSDKSSASKNLYIGTKNHQQVFISKTKLSKCTCNSSNYDNESYPRQTEKYTKNQQNCRTNSLNEASRKWTLQNFKESVPILMNKPSTRTNISSAKEQTRYDMTTKGSRPKTGPQHTCQRSEESTNYVFKKRSLLPVMKTQKLPLKETTASVAQENVAMKEKIMSTSAKRASSAKGSLPNGITDPKLKLFPAPSPCFLKNFLNEPIARSIAGYVANNISEKMKYLKMIQEHQPGKFHRK